MQFDSLAQELHSVVGKNARSCVYIYALVSVRKTNSQPNPGNHNPLFLRVLISQGNYEIQVTQRSYIQLYLLLDKRKYKWSLNSNKFEQNKSF